MTVYLIAYDLNKETKRPPIVKFIKDNFPWAMLSESSYAVESNLTPKALFDILEKHFLDNNDQLYVIRLALPWAGQGTQAVNDWLRAKMPLSQPLAA